MLILEDKRYPNKIIKKLLKDDRLKYIEGKITPFNRCKYENGKEVKEYGYNFTYIINVDDPLESVANGITLWTDNSSMIKVYQHFGCNDILEFNKSDVNNVENHIVNLVLGQNKKNKLYIKEWII